MPTKHTVAASISSRNAIIGNADVVARLTSEITNVPAPVRNRDRQIGAGDAVLQRYERTTFEKDLIAQALAKAGGNLRIDNANGRTRVVGEDRDDVEIIGAARLITEVTSATSTLTY